MHSGLAALAGRSESLETVQSRRGMWCCLDGSSPPPFAQRTSFCIAPCDHGPVYVGPWCDGAGSYNTWYSADH